MGDPLYSNLWNLSQANQTSVCRSIYSHICQPHISYIFINFNFLGSMQYINKAEQATALAANMSQQIWAWTHPSQQCHQSFLTKNGSRMMFSSFCTTVLCIFSNTVRWNYFQSVKELQLCDSETLLYFLSKNLSKVSSIERANFFNEPQMKLTWAVYAEPHIVHRQAQEFLLLHNHC